MSNLKYQRRVIQILLVKILVREFNDNILAAFSIQGPTGMNTHEHTYLLYYWHHHWYYQS